MRRAFLILSLLAAAAPIRAAAAGARSEAASHPKTQAAARAAAAFFAEPSEAGMESLFGAMIDLYRAEDSEALLAEVRPLFESRARAFLDRTDPATPERMARARSQAGEVDPKALAESLGLEAFFSPLIRPLLLAPDDIAAHGKPSLRTENSLAGGIESAFNAYHSNLSADKREALAERLMRGQRVLMGIASEPEETSAAVAAEPGPTPATAALRSAAPLYRKAWRSTDQPLSREVYEDFKGMLGVIRDDPEAYLRAPALVAEISGLPPETAADYRTTLRELLEATGQAPRVWGKLRGKGVRIIVSHPDEGIEFVPPPSGPDDTVFRFMISLEGGVAKVHLKIEPPSLKATVSRPIAGPDPSGPSRRKGIDNRLVIGLIILAAWPFAVACWVIVQLLPLVPGLILGWLASFNL